MKILGKNILITLDEKQKDNPFTDDIPHKAVATVFGIGEDVSINIKVGERIVFNPSAIITINEESWDVIPESAVICLEHEIKKEN